MNKLTVIIIAVLGLASCKKEGYTYNHDYTFDKTKFGYASGSFITDHLLTKEEERNWCYEMDKRVVDNLNHNPSNHYELSDIDTSFVYLVRN